MSDDPLDKDIHMDPHKKFEWEAELLGFLPGTMEYELAVLTAKIEYCQERMGVQLCNNCPRANFCKTRETYQQKKGIWRALRASELDHLRGSGDGSGSTSGGSSESP